MPIAFHAHSLYLTFFAEMRNHRGRLRGLADLAVCVELRRARSPVRTPRRAFLALSVTAGLVGVAVQGLIDTVSVVIFGLWMPTLALALAAARPSVRAAK